MTQLGTPLIDPIPVVHKIDTRRLPMGWIDKDQRLYKREIRDFYRYGFSQGTSHLIIVPWRIIQDQVDMVELVDTGNKIVYQLSMSDCQTFGEWSEVGEDQVWIVPTSIAKVC